MKITKETFFQSTKIKILRGGLKRVGPCILSQVSTCVKLGGYFIVCKVRRLVSTEEGSSFFFFLVNEEGSSFFDDMYVDL